MRNSFFFIYSGPLQHTATIPPESAAVDSDDDAHSTDTDLTDDTSSDTGSEGVCMSVCFAQCVRYKFPHFSNPSKFRASKALYFSKNSMELRGLSILEVILFVAVERFLFSFVFFCNV